MKNTALILIDIQNDYFDGGALELANADQAAKNASSLLNIFRTRQLPIIHIQHETLQPEMGFMLPGTRGQQIHSSVAPNEGEICLTKHYPNAFWNTVLEEVLKEQNITHAVVAGMMTHMCVSTTIRAAMERGFQVTAIQDACATRTLSLNNEEIPADVVHQTALAELTLIANISLLDQFIRNL